MTKPDYISNVLIELGNKLTIFNCTYDMPLDAATELACIAKSLGYVAAELKTMRGPNVPADTKPAKPQITPRKPLQRLQAVPA